MRLEDASQTKGKKMSEMKKAVADELQSIDEKANYVIEDLYHALDTAAAVIYKKWIVQGDAWSDIEIFNGDKKVKVFKARQLASLYVGFIVDGHLVYANSFVASDGLVGYVLIPMIEQFLVGDRKEVKDGLSPLLEVSPAII